MALSVTQNMNMNFLNSLMPKKETLPVGAQQPVTITTIAANMQDTFSRQTALSLKGMTYGNMSSVNGGGIVIAVGGTQQPQPFYPGVSPYRHITFQMNEPTGRIMPADQNTVVSEENVDAEWNVDVKTGPDDQRMTNQAQANQIKKQLNLSEDLAWGVDSLGEDLAVFGLDFTALKGNPDELIESLRAKAMEMVAEIDNNRAADNDYDARRRAVSGAYARLQNGLGRGNNAGDGAGGKTVTVGDTAIDANFVVSVSNVLADPLVLDLAGDGLNLKGADEGVQFDMDGDGEKSTMGFIRGDDALLFVDSHGDGVVHDSSQLFGNNDGYANGFEKLRSYDDNADGVIDEQDAIYDQLGVWVEKTEDGVSGEGETMSLREAGVKSINVGYDDVREDDGTGNLIGQKGSFTRDDGTSGLAADVWFQEHRQ